MKRIKRLVGFQDIVFVLGLSCIILGVGSVSRPAAWIVFGSALAAMAIFGVFRGNSRGNSRNSDQRP